MDDIKPNTAQWKRETEIPKNNRAIKEKPA